MDDEVEKETAPEIEPTRCESKCNCSDVVVPIVLGASIVFFFTITTFCVTLYHMVEVLHRK